eukprot:5069538-Lingulodinium_polyedra.AAC.2
MTRTLFASCFRSAHYGRPNAPLAAPAAALGAGPQVTRRKIAGSRAAGSEVLRAPCIVRAAGGASAGPTPSQRTWLHDDVGYCGAWA